MQKISKEFKSLARLIVASSCVLAMTLALMTPPAQALSGSGTATSPYLVSSGQDLDDAITALAAVGGEIRANYSEATALVTTKSADVVAARVRADVASADLAQKPNNKVLQDQNQAAQVAVGDALAAYNTAVNASATAKTTFDNAVKVMHYIKLKSDIDAVTSATYNSDPHGGGTVATIDGDGYTIDGHGVTSTAIRFQSELTPSNGGNRIVLKNLTMRNLSSPVSYGGGALGMEGGGLEIDNCVFVDNVSNGYGANDHGGGAVMMQTMRNGDPVKITNSSFYGNKANGGNYGGGALSCRGVLVLNNCTFYENSALSGKGGALFLINSSDITNCTIVGNSARDSDGDAAGGAIYVSSSTGGGGTGINNIALRNNILAGNSGKSDIATVDPALGIIKGTNNLIGTIADDMDETVFDNTAFGVKVSEFLASGAPKVNQKGTPTIALLRVSGSPAVNRGSTSLAPTLDQRGFERNGVPDIGAFELQASDADGSNSSDSDDSGDNSSGDEVVVEPVVPDSNGTVHFDPITFTDSNGNTIKAADIPKSSGLEKLGDMGLNAVINDDGQVEITGVAEYAGEVTFEVELADGSSKPVTITIDPIDQPSDGGRTNTTPGDVTGELFLDGAFEVYVPLGLTAKELDLALKANSASAVMSPYVFTTAAVTSYSFRGAGDYRGAGELAALVITGTSSAPEDLTIETVSYTVGINRYTKTLNTPISKTAVESEGTSQKSSGGGGCEAGFGVFALAIAGGTLIRRKG